MNGLQGGWAGVCLASVMGLAGADYYGYSPGTCTDARVANRQSTLLAPCSPRYDSTSIRNRHYYGGK